MSLLVLGEPDLERLFPAYLSTSADGEILAVGPSLLAQLGRCVRGAAFDDVFKVERPLRVKGFAGAVRCGKQLILHTSDGAVRLQGVALERSDRVIFALGHALRLEDGAPRLSHADFSLADSSADAYLAAIVNNRFAEEARLLAHELEKARGAAEAANKAKSAFLANVSHELRTPLNAIIGYSELLRDGAGDEGRAHDITDLNQIICAAKGLDTLITEVLDYTRLEERRSAIEAEPFNVAGLLDGLAEDVRAIVEANDNRLIVSPVNLPNCIGDEDKFYRCLRHLIGNAGRFTRHGEIHVEAHLDFVSGGPWLVFEVSDTGVGMNEEALENLAQALARGPSVQDARGDARLGLTLTQRIAETLGGELLIESEPGRGAIFTLRAPVRIEPMLARVG